jgi:hypothetical protein
MAARRNLLVSDSFWPVKSQLCKAGVAALQYYVMPKLGIFMPTKKKTQPCKGWVVAIR